MMLPKPAACPKNYVFGRSPTSGERIYDIAAGDFVMIGSSHLTEHKLQRTWNWGRYRGQSEYRDADGYRRFRPHQTTLRLTLSIVECRDLNSS